MRTKPSETVYRQVSCLSVVLLAVLLTFPGQRSYADTTSVGLTVTPLVSFPIGQSADLFTVGYGARLSGSFPLAPPLSIEGGLRYSLHPTRAQTSLSLIGLGGGLGTSFQLLPRMNLDASFDLGVFAGLYAQQFAANPYGSAKAATRFNFSPGFSLSVGAGYDYFLTRSDGNLAPLYNGIQATIGLHFVPGQGGSTQRAPKLQIQDPFYRPIFPVFFKYYDRNSFGKVTLKNTESTTITDITVNVYVNQYMGGPRVTAEIPKLSKGETVEIPLTALFTDEVLSITEPTAVSITVATSYIVDGTKLTAARTDTLRLLDRNALTWDDNRKVASFVTARDPTVLQFARHITAATREVGTTEVNENLRTAMAMFTALTMFGIDYVIDPKSSYADLSQTAATVDYVQFPVQTLQFRAGDCDDLSVLFAALLESVGIETAFVTVPGHIYVAFNLGLPMEEAGRLFGGNSELIEKQGSAWMPVEITLVRQGFLQAWTTGAREWREAQLSAAADFYPVRTAWQTFEPTGFSSATVALAIPEEKRIADAYAERLSQFVERQVSPQVGDLKRRITESGNNPRLINRLGTVYAKYGLYDRALVEFRRAADQNFAPALINIGNIQFLNQDFEGALTYYTRAKRLDPSEPLCVVAIARTQFELGKYADAQSNYRQAVALAPELATPYSYIVSENQEVGRASNASTRNRVTWGDK